MTSEANLSRRLVAAVVSVMIMFSTALPAATFAATTDPELLATLELPEGDIEYVLELGTLHFFDEENAPFAVQVLDGCSINDHLWLYGVGLSGIPMPLTVMDLNTGKSERIELPAFEPGEPIGGIVEPEALRVCGDAPTGGLPTLGGTATFTAADARSRDYTDTVAVYSDGRDDSYRRLARSGSSYAVMGKGSPIVAVDDSGAFDELLLLAEGRTPRHIEGVVFYGDEGMLPSRAKLDGALKGINNSRVRRAFETAKNSRVPQGIIEDLGLARPDRVYHVSFEFDTLGADAYLAEAGWIKDGGKPIDPPLPVEERFTVEIVRADGETVRLPLVGPLVGSDAEGQLWRYRSDDTMVQIIDACALGGSFWTLAAATIDEPVELVITDTHSGAVASHVLWTDREDVARLSDSSALTTCP